MPQRNLTLEEILLSKVIQYWSHAVTAYAVHKPSRPFVFTREKELCEAKHRSAFRFLANLSRCLPVIDENIDEETRIATQERADISARKNAVLRQLLDRFVSVEAVSDTTFDSTDCIVITSPQRSVTPHDDIKSSMNKTLDMFVEAELVEIEALRKRHVGYYSAGIHPPGSYDALLDVIRKNLDYAKILIKSLKLNSKTGYNKIPQERVSLHLALYLCKLNFDFNLYAANLLSAAQKQYCRTDSGYEGSNEPAFKHCAKKLQFECLDLFDTSCALMMSDHIAASDISTCSKFKCICRILTRMPVVSDSTVKIVKDAYQELAGEYIPVNNEDEFDDMVAYVLTVPGFTKIGDAMDWALLGRDRGRGDSTSESGLRTPLSDYYPQCSPALTFAAASVTTVPPNLKQRTFFPYLASGRRSAVSPMIAPPIPSDPFKTSPMLRT